MARKFKKIPIGNSNFEEIIEEGFYYVDKSLFIQEILDSGSKVSLITRPRRFGKTINLMMLKAFFELDMQDFRDRKLSSLQTSSRQHPKEKLFHKLAIWQQGEEYTSHQGKYPVIFLSLKDSKKNTWSLSYQLLKQIIADEYKKHKYLLESDYLDQTEKNDFQRILTREASEFILGDSLKSLIKHLYHYHNQKVIVLIDEYDSPVHEAYEHGFYQEIIEFLLSFLGGALKDNKNLERAVITGILRVTKENIFSDLNNPDIITLLNDKYADKFGFTEAEVVKFLNDYQLEYEMENVKKWYDGYVIGKVSDIYNPWSILNFVDKHEEGFKPYWVNTSRNTLINHLLAHSNKDVKNELEQLIANNSITKRINSHIIFSDIERNSEALWSFLLFSGYLKTTKIIQDGKNIQYELMIPNLEVEYVFETFIEEWFTNYLADGEITVLFRALLSGDYKTVRQALQKYVLGAMSFFDPTGSEPEKVYHAFVLGLLVNMKTHRVKSNRESGFGRYDIMLIPLDLKDAGVVMEFKKVEEEDDETLDTACDAALLQIEKKQYETELRDLGVQEIYKYGIGFEGKSVKVKSA
ncbi:MAG: AAA family ATPase [Leptospiraceae bacterium]|nr:AAA family ATPase [Leptospiraceae bacterium]MCP5500746.1 AAA family ATPase [Leptospiraceae bacterium]